MTSKDLNRLSELLIGVRDGRLRVFEDPHAPLTRKSGRQVLCVLNGDAVSVHPERRAKFDELLALVPR